MIKTADLKNQYNINKNYLHTKIEFLKFDIISDHSRSTMTVLGKIIINRNIHISKLNDINQIR